MTVRLLLCLVASLAATASAQTPAEVGGVTVGRISDVVSALDGPRLVRDVVTRADVVVPLEGPADRVRYHVRGRLAADALEGLLRLAEADGLHALTAESATDGTAVSVEFRFATAEAWAAWQASGATAALLAPLADVRTTLQVEGR